MTAYRLISAEKARTPVSMACRLLGVSRSGYYEWAANAPSERDVTDAWLTERIRVIHTAHRGVYGAPRIHADLRMAHGIGVGRKRVERLMRQAGISGLVRRRRGRTTIQVPGVRVADDLVERRFRPPAPNVLWVADVTYCGPGRLAVSRGGPGRLQPRDRRLVDGRPHALRARRRRAADGRPAPSARTRVDPPLRPGSQYVSLAFGHAARDAGIARSMGSKGDCYDNAVAESFFATLKKELVHRRCWPTRRDLTTEIFEYIEAFYNRTRRHSTLGMLSPLDLENSTLREHRAGLAASRLASIQTEIIST